MSRKKIVAQGRANSTNLRTFKDNVGHQAQFKDI